MDLDDGAVRFAQAGIPVFPLAPGGKVPLTANGLYAATTDLAQIKAWWARTPEANIGMPTGASCGWDVLDVDPSTKYSGAGKQRRDGWDAINALRDAGLLPDPILTVRTPSGGAHLYYRATAGAKNGSLAEWGLDYRAAGGYVVVPPSRTPSGSYVTTSGPFTERSANVCNFDQLRYALAPPAPRTPRDPGMATNSVGRAARRVDALTRTVTEAAQGNRNNVLYWAARVSLTENLDCLPALHQAARVAGLTEEEAARTIGSAQRPNAQAASPVALGTATGPPTARSTELSL